MPEKELRSPCAKPECISNDKTKCSKDCRELAEFQRYLDLIHDRYSPPAIDPAGDYRAVPQ